MSTEAKVSPYEENIENKNQGSSVAADMAVGAVGFVAGAAVSVAVGTVKLAATCLMLDEKQKAALARRKEEERKERARLKKLDKLELTVIPLKLSAPDTLVKSAANLGFRLQSLEMPKAALHSQPSITLAKPSGETLTIKRGATGRLVLEAPKNSVTTVQDVVKRHTVDQAIKHLKKQCKSVQVKKGQNGDYIIVGQEGNHGQKGGSARITTHVLKNGVATVDVSNIKGKRCDEIINGLTRAIGGECVKSRKKSEYFQVPVKEKERVRV